ncbi:alpha-N-acetylgalactosaminidase [Hemicordylus capensis]|uniref:alpha-N-acetylgalactosaminidase n=1 Tax=Hemicordylus capensis TaxID=884348 RepID=UPI002302CB58|nr:alpha-N-acetylgalactosaminidase [Hemicordylus capensis]
MKLAVSVILALATSSLALENGLMRTPPMGWLAWERFRCNVDCKNDPHNCISEKLFMEMADSLAADGWRELGYVYVNMDDCWMAKERNAEGQLIPDPERFPRGIKALADYVHSRGLKLGIYADLGNYTCSGYPGTTLDHIEQDALTFAQWGVDMLKFDGCYSDTSTQAKGYPRMAQALNASSHPIAYSCSWPAYHGGLPPEVNYTLLAGICNLWRNYDDIQDSWDSVLSIVDWFTANQEVIQSVAGPGHWNDPDMLIIGNFGLSYEQSQSQMALWTVLAAPLFISTDLRTISEKAWEILKNKLMIKINQDPLGIQGRRILQENSSHIEVFLRPLSHSASAVVFFSRRTDVPYRYTTSLAQLNFTQNALYEAQDVYTGKIRSLKTSDNFTVVINPTGVVMWYLYPTMHLEQPKQQSDTNFHPFAL